MMSAFEEIAPFLNDPLVLIGFIGILVFGIFRSILKLKFVPKLSRGSAEKIIRTMLNYGFMLMLCIIFLGFLLEGYKIISEKPIDSGNNAGTNIARQDSLNPITDYDSLNRSASQEKQFQKKMENSQNSEDVYYEVKLLIPATMQNPRIFIDGRPAKIIDQSLTVTTILVKKKDTNHKIIVKTNDRTCTKEILIRKDMELTPCQ